MRILWCILWILHHILHISSTIVVPPGVFKISSPEYPGSAKHIDRRSSWRFQHFSLDAALAWLRERRSSAVCKPNARNLGETVKSGCKVQGWQPGPCFWNLVILKMDENGRSLFITSWQFKPLRHEIVCPRPALCSNYARLNYLAEKTGGDWIWCTWDCF